MHPGEGSVAEGDTYSALSNDELGALWSETLRAHAVRRTGSSRDFWRQLLNEPDVDVLLSEFKRRAFERAEEYEAWSQLGDF